MYGKAEQYLREYNKTKRVHPLRVLALMVGVRW